MVLLYLSPVYLQYNETSGTVSPVYQHYDTIVDHNCESSVPTLWLYVTTVLLWVHVPTVQWY